MNLPKILLTVFTALLFSACGTDSGNPGITPPSSSPLVTDFIGSKVCQKLKTCFSLPLANCDYRIQFAENFTSGMGLSPATYPNLEAVLEAVRSSRLQVSQAQVMTCQQSIEALSCADAKVTASYNENVPNDFSQAYRVLGVDSSCAQMVQ